MKGREVERSKGGTLKSIVYFSQYLPQTNSDLDPSVFRMRGWLSSAISGASELSRGLTLSPRWRGRPSATLLSCALKLRSSSGELKYVPPSS